MAALKFSVDQQVRLIETGEEGVVRECEPHDDGPNVYCVYHRLTTGSRVEAWIEETRLAAA